MKCPHCGAQDSHVVDSRPAERGRAVRRRRQCEACDERFTTYERLEAPLLIRKRDGTMQVFAVDKVRKGLVRALAGSSVTADEISDAVTSIESDVLAAGSNISTDEIGRMVLAYLVDVDEAAYLRFVSVHRDFRDASDFEREVATLDRSDIEA